MAVVTTGVHGCLLRSYWISTELLLSFSGGGTKRDEKDAVTNLNQEKNDNKIQRNAKYIHDCGTTWKRRKEIITVLLVPGDKLIHWAKSKQKDKQYLLDSGRYLLLRTPIAGQKIPEKVKPQGGPRFSIVQHLLLNKLRALSVAACWLSTKQIHHFQKIDCGCFTSCDFWTEWSLFQASNKDLTS